MGVLSWALTHTGRWVSFLDWWRCSWLKALSALNIPVARLSTLLHLRLLLVVKQGWVMTPLPPGSLHPAWAFSPPHNMQSSLCPIYLLLRAHDKIMTIKRTDWNETLNFPASYSMAISAPGSAGLHCLPAGGSWLFELENHSQSVLHLFEISSIQDFLFHVAWLYMKKVPWNMQMVVNWHSSFPFLVSCLLSLRWNLSMFCSREHK